MRGRHGSSRGSPRSGKRAASATTKPRLRTGARGGPLSRGRRQGLRTGGHQQKTTNSQDERSSGARGALIPSSIWEREGRAVAQRPAAAGNPRFTKRTRGCTSCFVTIPPQATNARAHVRGGGLPPPLKLAGVFQAESVRDEFQAAIQAGGSTRHARRPLGDPRESPIDGTHTNSVTASVAAPPQPAAALPPELPRRRIAGARRIHAPRAGAQRQPYDQRPAHDQR